MTNPTSPTGWQAFLSALKSGGWVSILTSLVTIATTYGLLSALQANAIESAAAAVASAFSAIVALVHNVQVTRAMKASTLKPRD